MRTKRFLSLALALAMTATISVSAAETSKVYLTEDFPENEYSSKEALYVTAGYGYWDELTGKYVDYTFDHDNDESTTEIGIWAGSKISGGYWETTTNAAARWYRQTTTKALREAGEEYFLTWWNGGPAIASGTNSEGKQALVFDPGKAVSTSMKLYRILPENWVANENEAFVISADVDPVALYKTATYYGVILSGVFSYTDPTTGEVSLTGGKPLLQSGPKKVTVGEGDEATTETVLMWHPSCSANYSTGYEDPVTLGKTYDFTTVITASGDYMKRQSWLDGAKWGGSTNNGISTKNTVEGIHIDFGGSDAWKMADLKAYTLSLKAGAFNASTALGDVIPATTITVPVKFSQPVNEFTYDKAAVTVTEAGEALVYGEDFVVSDVTEVVEGNDIYSTAVVSFLTGLEADTEYVITFPADVMNTAGTKLEGYNTITVRTPAPDIKLESFNIIKGWGTEAETTADAFVADGSVQAAVLGLRNTTEAQKNVAVIYAIYSSNGQLSDVVYANDTIAGGTTTDIYAGAKLSAEGTVKAFVWDGVTSLKPYAGSNVKTIAAAE